MERTDQGQMGFGHNYGVQNSLHQPPSTMAPARDSGPGRTVQESSLRGNTKSNAQGRGEGSGTTPGTVFINPVSRGERKRYWRVSASHKPKAPEQISNNREIQNGGAPHNSESFTAKRLHDETRPKGRILPHTNTPGVQEIPSLPVRRDDLPVSVPPFRARDGSTCIHESNAPSDCTNTFRRSTDGDLPRRSLNYAPKQAHAQKHLHECCTAADQSRIHSKTREMLTRPDQPAGFSGGTPGHQPDGVISPTGQAPDNCDVMQQFGRNKGVHHASAVEFAGTNEPCGTDGAMGGPSSLSCPPTPPCTISAHTGLEITGSHSCHSNSTQRSPVVVISSSPGFQLSSPDAPYNRSEYTNRRVPSGMGGSVQWSGNRGALECQGSKGTHQLLGTQGSTPGTSSVSETDGHPTSTHPSRDGQHDSGGIRQPEGGHTVTHVVSVSTGDLVLPPVQGHLDNSPPPTRSPEHRCGHSISGVQQSHGVDTQRSDLQGDNREILHPRDRPLRVSPQQQSAEICVTLSRPGSSGSGCLQARLEPMEKLHTPSDSVTTTSLTEDPERSSNHSPDSSRLAGSAMVPSAPTDASGPPNPVAQRGITPTSSIPTGSSAPAMAHPQADCMATIREGYQSSGLPSQVIDILVSSWSSGTQKRYRGPWRSWCQWCLQRGLCPVSAPVESVLTFLAELALHQGLEFKTIAIYKSAISQAHIPVEGSLLGELPVVSRFMKGVFRMKPPKPRLSSTWEVQRLLQFLSTLHPLSSLKLKQLSLKLAALLALTSAARAHELVKLDLQFVTKKTGSWEFTLASHVKTSRPGHPQRRIYLPAFDEDPRICVIRALEEYYLRTEKLRKSSHLLISYVKPYGAISSQTLSRWLRCSLRLAGIEPHFTAHSTRSASTSAASKAGLPLEAILNAADWSSSRTFELFYHRPSSRGDFAVSVLQCAAP